MMKKILFLVAIVTFIFAASSLIKAENKKEVSLNTEIINMDNQVKQDTLFVQGMCGMCKTRIEKAAKSVKGVASASWDMATKKLQVAYDPSRTSVEAVSKAIAKVGHDTEKDKASQASYDALPACCKYRDK